MRYQSRRQSLTSNAGFDGKPQGGLRVSRWVEPSVEPTTVEVANPSDSLRFNGFERRCPLAKQAAKTDAAQALAHSLGAGRLCTRPTPRRALVDPLRPATGHGAGLPGRAQGHDGEGQTRPQTATKSSKRVTGIDARGP